MDQDAERFEVEVDGAWRELRCQDYPDIYEIPGLYEQLFRDRLACTSPQVVVELLNDALGENDSAASDLRVLDLGAGNGLVGEQLRAVEADRLRRPADGGLRHRLQPRGRRRLDRLQRQGGLPRRRRFDRLRPPRRAHAGR